MQSGKNILGLTAQKSPAGEIIKNYDYFCFMHDKKSQGKEYITIGSNFRDALWENNLASQEYIEAIINEFIDNGFILGKFNEKCDVYKGNCNNF